MAKLFVEETSLTNVADAIRTKGNTTEQLVFPEGFVDGINNIQSGGGTEEKVWDGVYFMDYDATIVAEYTIEEARALTELPPLPVHEGWVSEGWNWTLEEVHTIEIPTIIGVTYHTNDKKLHIGYKITEPNTVVLTPSFESSGSDENNNHTVIDWGDGNIEETGNRDLKHIYAKPGNYVAKVSIDSTAFLTMRGVFKAEYIIFPDNMKKISEVTIVMIHGNLIDNVILSSTLPYEDNEQISLFGSNSKLITIPRQVIGKKNVFKTFTDITQSYTNKEFISLPKNWKDAIYLPPYEGPFGCSVRDNVILRNKVPPINSTKNTFGFYGGAVDGGSMGYYYPYKILYMPSNIEKVSFRFFNGGKIEKIKFLGNIQKFSNADGNIGVIFDFSHNTQVPINDYYGLSNACFLVPKTLETEWKNATNWCNYAEYITGV